MRGFRQAMNTGLTVAHNAFQHGRRAVMQLDRHLGSAARLYGNLAPALAPVAKELFGEGRSNLAHKAISDGISSYQNVRGKVQRTHRMAESITRSVKKEIPSIIIK